MLGYGDLSSGMDHCDAIAETNYVSSCSNCDALPKAYYVLRGGSALSLDHRHIAVYNLIDGLDLYATGSYGKQKPRKTYKFSKPRLSKHALQVCFAHHRKALVCGTTTGGILLWEVATGDRLQELNHAGRASLAISRSH